MANIKHTKQSKTIECTSLTQHLEAMSITANCFNDRYPDVGKLPYVVLLPRRGEALQEWLPRQPSQHGRSITNYMFYVCRSMARFSWDCLPHTAAAAREIKAIMLVTKAVLLRNLPRSIVIDLMSAETEPLPVANTDCASASIFESLAMLSSRGARTDSGMLS